MKRFLINIIKDPLLIFKIIFYTSLITIYRLRGVKTVVFNIHYDYFFDIFRPVYLKLNNHPGIRIFFSYESSLKDYLLKHVDNKSLIKNTASPFVPFDMFICPEVNDPDFPVSFFKTKTVEIYHGMGTSSLYEKKDVVNRFDIHLSIGPQFNDFIEFAYDGMDRAPVIYNTGYAKLDQLLGENSQNDTLREEYGINGKPIILYAPHWHPEGSLHSFEESIIETLASFNAHILIKPHNYLFKKYSDMNWRQKFQDLAIKHSNITFIERPDTQELYPIADIMITDTGTTAALEFSLLHKPLILFYNENWFTGKSHIEPEKDTCDTAFKFTELNELAETIRLITAEDSEIVSLLQEQQKKQDILIKKYLFNPGGATKRSANAILKEINLQMIS